MGGVGDREQVAQQRPADAAALVGGVDADRVHLGLGTRHADARVADDDVVDPGGDVVEARPQLLPEGLLGPGVVACEEEPVERGAAGGVGFEQRSERDGHGHTLTRLRAPGSCASGRRR